MKHICQALRIPGMFIDEYIHVGSGTLEGDVVINVSKTKQDPSAYYRSVYGNATIGLSGNSATAIAEGGRLEGKITSAFNLSSSDFGLRGGTLIATHAGTGVVTAAVGGLSLVQNQNLGTITTGYSHIIASGDNSGGGTLTNLVGIAVANQSVGTNNTLLLMGTLTPLSSNYAIYSASTYESLFAGNITANAVISSNRQNIQTTTTAGFVLTNNELSTSGITNQWSPSLDFIGHAWRTAIGDRYVRFRAETQTTAGASPSGTLVIKSSVDTGTESWTDRLTLTSAGVLTASALVGTTSITNSSLVSGRVVVSGTAGIQTDFSTLTFNGTQLAMSTTGSSGGIRVGGDADLYRSAADSWTCPDHMFITPPNNTATSGTVYGTSVNWTLAPAANTSGTYFTMGFSSVASNNNNFTDALISIIGGWTHSGTGTVTRYEGLSLQYAITSSGTLTTGYAVRVLPDFSSSGACTTWRGISSAPPRLSGGGTCVTCYLLSHELRTVSGSGAITTLIGYDCFSSTSGLSGGNGVTANGQTRIGIDIGPMPDPTSFTGTSVYAIRFSTSARVARNGLQWGSDSSCNLYSSASNVLKTDGSLVVATNLTVSTMTSGSLLFAGTSGLVSQDNSNLYWDDTNNTLGIGTTRTGAISGTNPSVRIKGTGTTSSTSSFEIQDSAATSLFLVKDNGTTSLTGTLTITKAFNSGVSTLTDGATPALDASLGNTFLLTAAGNRTIAVPTNPTSGQKITIVHKASGGDRTLALNTGAGGFRFGTDITALTATTSGLTDYIGAIYNAADSKWDVVSYVKGF